MVTLLQEPKAFPASCQEQPVLVPASEAVLVSLGLQVSQASELLAQVSMGWPVMSRLVWSPELVSEASVRMAPD